MRYQNIRYVFCIVSLFYTTIFTLVPYIIDIMKSAHAVCKPKMTDMSSEVELAEIDKVKQYKHPNDDA